MKSGNEQVEEELLKLLQHLNDAMSTLEKLDDGNRPALISSVDSIVKSFQKLHELEPQVEGSVPLELIDQIDKGNNPDEYSRKLIEECRMSAKRVEEKQKWMSAFKDSLDEYIKANPLD